MRWSAFLGDNITMPGFPQSRLESPGFVHIVGPMDFCVTPFAQWTIFLTDKSAKVFREGHRAGRLSSGAAASPRTTHRSMITTEGRGGGHPAIDWLGTELAAWSKVTGTSTPRLVSSSPQSSIIAKSTPTLPASATQPR